MVNVMRVNVLVWATCFRVMNEYANYNYKIDVHTHFIQTVSFIIIEGQVIHDILTLL